VLGFQVVRDFIKPNREGDPEAGLGTEGGRSTRSTEDSGPMTPGNRAEDKTLKTRKRDKRRTVLGREPAACDGQQTTVKTMRYYQIAVGLTIDHREKLMTYRESDQSHSTLKTGEPATWGRD
jgi:hypothetical protein